MRSQEAAYIGITGFNTVDDVQTVGKHINSYPVGYVMFGFTSSNKRLLDPTSSGKTSPALNSIHSLVKAVPHGHLPMIHYFTTNPELLDDEVIALFEYCELVPAKNDMLSVQQRPIAGLQLNALWPSIEQLQNIQSYWRSNEHNQPNLVKPVIITLQLPKEALETSDEAIVHRLKNYRDVISYILIDPSGGAGIDVSMERATKLMLKIQKEIPEITPGVAGGFSPENVDERIKTIREISKCDSCHQEQLRNYCIDAQGKLREEFLIRPVFPADAPVQKVSRLAPQKAIQFVDKALQAFYAEEK